MKAGTLDGHATKSAEKTSRRQKGGNSFATTRADSDRMTQMLHAAQEMGGPLNVVLGRMELLLERVADRETARSLSAIMSQAQQLVELRQYLMDQARAELGVADLDPPVPS